MRALLVVFTMPYVGYLGYFVGTPIGFILLIVIPASLAREEFSFVRGNLLTLVISWVFMFFTFSLVYPCHF